MNYLSHNRGLRIVQTIDWLSIVLFFSIMIVGWFSIYSSSYNSEASTKPFLDVLFSTNYGKQAIWIVVSVTLSILLFSIDGSFYRSFAYLSFFISIVLLIIVFFIAKATNGAYSWISIGGFKLQPTEFAKFSTALALARFLADSGKTSIPKHFRLGVSSVIILLPVALIILQKDAGSALIFLSLFIVLFRVGLVSDTVFFSALLLIGVVLLSLSSGVLLTYCIISFAALLYMLVQGLGKRALIVGITLLALFLIDTLLIDYFIPEGSDFFQHIYFSSADIEDSKLASSSPHFLSVITLQAAPFLIAMLLGIALTIRRNKNLALVVAIAMLSIVAVTSTHTAFSKLPNHQQKRIQVFLGILDDPQGYGWDAKQIEIAVGSGGITGKGFNNGSQVKNDFISEKSTDFIFCTIAEEGGFVVSGTLIVLYLTLFIRLLFLAERQPLPFQQYYGYSVILILFFHFLINLGMHLGFVPIIGIPLPLVSYGGSSLIGFTFLFSIFIRLDAERYSGVHL